MSGIRDLSESVVMLMEGFLAVTAVLEPHLLLRPAAAPDSCSPSTLPVPGDDLLLLREILRAEKAFGVGLDMAQSRLHVLYLGNKGPIKGG